jgi:5-methylcytosine-specific restriction endonuclease McrA
MSRKINDGLTRNQRYYRNHKSSNAGRIRAWREKNRDRNLIISRRAYSNNREKRLEYKRIYYQSVRRLFDKTEDGKIRDRIRKGNRRANKFGVPHLLTAIEWKAILARHNSKCHWCGTEGRMEQDHIIPITKGGAHISSNIVPSCKSCNASRGNRHLIPLRLIK